MRCLWDTPVTYSHVVNSLCRKYQFKTAFLLMFSIGLFSLPVQAKYGGGTGEPNDPYLIFTAEQMNIIGTEPKDLDKHFELMADIDMSNYTGTDFHIIGADWDIPFIGSFNGNGHKICNFTYNSTEKNNIGIFGHVGRFNTQAFIKDVILIDPNIDAGTGNNVGPLIGWYYDATISGCYVEGGSVRGNRGIGGLIGNGLVGNITNCHSSAIVFGGDNVGGLIGECGGGGFLSHLDRIRISDCYASSSVSGRTYVGGLVGWFSDGGRIVNCYAIGKISGTVGVGGLVGKNEGKGDIYGDTISNCSCAGEILGAEGVGGLVGINGDNYWFGQTISNCYSTCKVSAAQDVGGLVGHNLDLGKVNQCYSSGKVEGNVNTGGLIGYNSEGTIEDSFWDTQTSHQAISDGGIGKTTLQMQRRATFVNWDFTEIWDLAEDQTYPFLRRRAVGDINGDCKVDFKDFVLMATHWLEDKR